KSRTLTGQPQLSRWRASTKPSPPLLPPPQTTTVRRFFGLTRRTCTATPRPAFSISSTLGTANSATARRSNSRACSRVSGMPLLLAGGFALHNSLHAEIDPSPCPAVPCTNAFHDSLTHPPNASQIPCPDTKCNAPSSCAVAIALHALSADP